MGLSDAFRHHSVTHSIRIAPEQARSKGKSNHHLFNEDPSGLTKRPIVPIETVFPRTGHVVSDQSSIDSHDDSSWHLCLTEKTSQSPT